MNRNVAIWFVAGLVCGLGSLLLALAIVSGPSQAPASPPAQSIDETRVGKAVVRFVEKMTTEEEPGGTDAHQASLLSYLQTVRSQIELYKVQHNGRAPGLDTEGRFFPDLFVWQMTRPTKVNGVVWSGQGRRAYYAFGPYLRSMPVNPFVKGPAASRVSGGQGPPPGDDSTGWYFNTRTGKFSANDPANKGK